MKIFSYTQGWSLQKEEKENETEEILEKLIAKIHPRLRKDNKMEIQKPYYPRVKWKHTNKPTWKENRKNSIQCESPEEGLNIRYNTKI
jgi:poly-D-alanine transfer protein DltD